MIDPEGSRTRYFHERKRVQAQAGNPIQDGVSQDARARLIREINARAVVFDVRTIQDEPLFGVILQEFRRVTGVSIDDTRQLLGIALERFLTFLEIASNIMMRGKPNPSNLEALQSVLADDLSLYRLRYVGDDADPPIQIAEIDGQHLHETIVDRAFELTRVTQFASAQRDYAEAWKHYSAGDFDDALVNAHKAVESAAKVVIKRVDATCACDAMQMNQLVPELVRLDILPRQMNTVVEHLRHIFQSSGSLRNAAGTGHGSLDVVSPEGSVTLLGLRLSGTLIAFLAERCGQMQPHS